MYSSLGLSVSFSKSVVQLTGMFLGEDGFLNIDEETFFTPDTIFGDIGFSGWM